jgi:hypothetical protein
LLSSVINEQWNSISSNNHSTASFISSTKEEVKSANHLERGDKPLKNEEQQEV